MCHQPGSLHSASWGQTLLTDTQPPNFGGAGLPLTFCIVLGRGIRIICIGASVKAGEISLFPPPASKFLLCKPVQTKLR